MHNGEWSLVSFTLISQLCVGLIWGFGFLFFLHHSLFQNLTGGITMRSPEFMILILIVIAALLSLLHLGSPLHSYNSLNNLKGSWISREILMLALFGLGILLFLISRWLDWPPVFAKIFIIYSVVAAAFLIVAMSGIYMIPTVPSWNNFSTPLAFVSSAFLLGIAGMILFFIYAYPSMLHQLPLTRLLFFLLIIFFILLIATGFHQYQLSRFNFTGIKPLSPNRGLFFGLFLVRIFLQIILIAGLIFLLNKINAGEIFFPVFTSFFKVIAILILVEEIIGRYLFYGSYFRVGV